MEIEYEIDENKKIQDDTRNSRRKNVIKNMLKRRRL
jgi:hypothetical protein